MSQTVFLGRENDKNRCMVALRNLVMQATRESGCQCCGAAFDKDHPNLGLHDSGCDLDRAMDLYNAVVYQQNQLNCGEVMV